LGSIPAVSLAQARTRAAQLRERIKKGENARAPNLRSKPEMPTFAAAARDCHAALKAGWRNKRHRDSWLKSLETHAFPHIGDLPVNAISSLMVRDALVPIWLAIPETARRVLQRIGTVLDYAHLSGWREQETSLRAVPKGLPRQPPEESHYVAMPYEEVPGFVARLLKLEETAGRDALLFTIHTAARSGETRHAVWSEVDLNTRTWTIPAARMKMRQQHVVPLTPAVIEILQRRWKLRSDDNDLVFSNYGKKPLSDMTLTQQLRRMELQKITVHGFRSSFTDWAAESTDFRKEVVDKALAHKLADRVEAAYRRTDFFERRRALMLAWSAYIGSV
jgi:integrase